MALAIAAVGFALSAFALVNTSTLATGLYSTPLWALQLVLVTLVCAPLVLAAVIAGRIGGSGGWLRAVGLGQWQVTDLVFGLGAGLVLRAVIELFAPTSASLRNPLADDVAVQTASIVAVVVTTAVITPVAEEVFFRGLVQRSLETSLASTGRTTAAISAILLSTTAFVVLHAASAGGTLTVGILTAAVATGVACGILTTLTGRLTAAIVAHVVSNLLGVVLFL